GRIDYRDGVVGGALGELAVDEVAVGRAQEGTAGSAEAGEIVRQCVHCQYLPESRVPPPGTWVGRSRRFNIWWVVHTAAEMTGRPCLRSAASIAGSDGICTHADRTSAS